MTKMTATVHVEFELLKGQANNTANTALIGGVGALKLAIERGLTGTGQTGVNSGKYCGSEDHLIATTGPTARVVRPTGSRSRTWTRRQRLD